MFWGVLKVFSLRTRLRRFNQSWDTRFEAFLSISSHTQSPREVVIRSMLCRSWKRTKRTEKTTIRPNPGHIRPNGSTAPVNQVQPMDSSEHSRHSGEASCIQANALFHSGEWIIFSQATFSKSLETPNGPHSGEWGSIRAYGRLLRANAGLFHCCFILR